VKIRALLRSHPELLAVPLGTYFWIGSFTSVGVASEASNEAQQILMPGSHGPDPILPLTLACALLAFLLTYVAVTRRTVRDTNEGRISHYLRPLLIAAPLPIGAVGLFELVFQFELSRAIPTLWFLLDSHGLICLSSMAGLGFIGVGWWNPDRVWSILLIGTAAGFVVWFLVGFPLPIHDTAGYYVPNRNIPLGFAFDASLKAAVFAVLTYPIVGGAQRDGPPVDRPNGTRPADRVQ